MQAMAVVLSSQVGASTYIHEETDGGDLRSEFRSPSRDGVFVIDSGEGGSIGGMKIVVPLTMVVSRAVVCWQRTPGHRKTPKQPLRCCLKLASLAYLDLCIDFWFVAAGWTQGNWTSSTRYRTIY